MFPVLSSYKLNSYKHLCKSLWSHTFSFHRDKYLKAELMINCMRKRQTVFQSGGAILCHITFTTYEGFNHLTIFWASYLTTLCFGFLICKMKIITIIASTSQECLRISQINELYFTNPMTPILLTFNITVIKTFYDQ